MPLVEKEIIRPGSYFYRDQETGEPRKLVVTPELTKYWFEQGNAMLKAGLTIPVPMEHDFDAHPMTAADKLKNNAGWVREYRMKGNVLFSSLDIPDEEIRKKLPHTIRWTSPWINSFTDGNGKDWKNVISHLALTTRPRIVEQRPFQSIAAAMSMATEVRPVASSGLVSLGATGVGGLCLSRAGRLFTDKKTNRLRPRYPMAFSLWSGGIPLAAEDVPPTKEELPDEEEADPAEAEAAAEGAAKGATDGTKKVGPPDALKDASGDVKMEEVLCHLLQALGVPMPDDSNENEFKRHLYEAAMSKVKELTSKGMGKNEQEDAAKAPDQNLPPTQQPNASQPQVKPNPLIQQEQQPMYMSLEQIEQLPDPMKGIALSWYQENAKIQAQLDAAKKVTDGMVSAKLAEANAVRAKRVALLARISPRVKADLDAMLALPGYALSMGDGGAVVDPMAQTLAVLEKGISDMPRLLSVDQSALSVQPQPSDETMLSSERAEEVADSFARAMGCSPKKAS